MKRYLELGSDLAKCVAFGLTLIALSPVVAIVCIIGTRRTLVNLNNRYGE